MHPATIAQHERRAAPLPNPKNDVADILSVLCRLGFEVTTELDADRVELTGALRAFHAPERRADSLAGVLRGLRIVERLTIQVEQLIGMH